MEILILSNEEQDRNLFISCLSADKSLFTFCPSEAKRGEYFAALRRYQERSLLLIPRGLPRGGFIADMKIHKITHIVKFNFFMLNCFHQLFSLLYR
ncbi:MAG: hypothetical protein A2736_02795 [Candidatus Yanofskybacteria bacterium RIFCSPHIGHO2_01_FULL_41_27]|uniref:Uncharacterized protein n=3 Tax=Parcubacteria group TaxID=1794811 RepID=A0A1F8HSI9_9BACT|nr:MAG: hypothetical protein A2736_02795 [Candidatus Yanofskybacteria bacterium RIFCSPHIGHO2_01_FULL_41_27]OGN40472.1 MAG: hypothetical protein A2606_01775 [Candidatus Yanofskybacteria bacterium RIFOXYD1_FULL_42_10]